MAEILKFLQKLDVVMQFFKCWIVGINEFRNSSENSLFEFENSLNSLVKRTVTNTENSMESENSYHVSCFDRTVRDSALRPGHRYRKYIIIFVICNTILLFVTLMYLLSGDGWLQYRQRKFSFVSFTLGRHSWRHNHVIFDLTLCSLPR